MKNIEDNYALCNRCFELKSKMDMLKIPVVDPLDKFKPTNAYLCSDCIKSKVPSFNLRNEQMI